MQASCMRSHCKTHQMIICSWKNLFEGHKVQTEPEALGVLDANTVISFSVFLTLSALHQRGNLHQFALLPIVGNLMIHHCTIGWGPWKMSDSDLLTFCLILSASKYFKYISLSFYICRGQNEHFSINSVRNKLAKLRRHASRVHFALIHFG